MSEHQSVWIGMYLDEDTAHELAFTGAEAPEDLHCTLAMVAENADDLTDDQIASLVLEVESWAKGTGPLFGEIAGPGRFLSGDQPVTVALVDAPSLPAARQDLVDRLARAGIPVSRDHGYTPHITLAYADLPDLAPEGFVHFGHVSVGVRGNYFTYALGGGQLPPNVEPYSEAETVAKADPIDGDGDGLVNDGRPTERPATPAEMEAGSAAIRPETRAGYHLVSPEKAAAARKRSNGRPLPDAQARAKNSFGRAIRGEQVASRDDWVDAASEAKSIDHINGLFKRVQADTTLSDAERASVVWALQNQQRDLTGQPIEPMPKALADAKPDAPTRKPATSSTVTVPQPRNARPSRPAGLPARTETPTATQTTETTETVPSRPERPAALPARAVGRLDLADLLGTPATDAPSDGPSDEPQAPAAPRQNLGPYDEGLTITNNLGQTLRAPYMANVHARRDVLVPADGYKPKKVDVLRALREIAEDRRGNARLTNDELQHLRTLALAHPTLQSTTAHNDAMRVLHYYSRTPSADLVDGAALEGWSIDDTLFRGPELEDRPVAGVNRDVIAQALASGVPVETVTDLVTAAARRNASGDLTAGDFLNSSTYENETPDKVADRLSQITVDRPERVTRLMRRAAVAARIAPAMVSNGLSKPRRAYRPDTPGTFFGAPGRQVVEDDGHLYLAGSDAPRTESNRVAIVQTPTGDHDLTRTVHDYAYLDSGKIAVVPAFVADALGLPALSPDKANETNDRLGREGSQRLRDEIAARKAEEAAQAQRRLEALDGIKSDLTGRRKPKKADYDAFRNSITPGDTLTAVHDTEAGKVDRVLGDVTRIESGAIYYRDADGNEKAIQMPPMARVLAASSDELAAYDTASRDGGWWIRRGTPANAAPEAPAAPAEPEVEEYDAEFLPAARTRSATDGKRNARIDADEARDRARADQWSSDGGPVPVDENGYVDPTTGETTSNLARLLATRPASLPARQTEPVDTEPGSEDDPLPDDMDFDESLAATYEPADIIDVPVLEVTDEETGTRAPLQLESRQTRERREAEAKQAARAARIEAVIEARTGQIPTLEFGPDGSMTITGFVQDTRDDNPALAAVDAEITALRTDMADEAERLRKNRTLIKTARTEAERANRETLEARIATAKYTEATYGGYPDTVPAGNPLMWQHGLANRDAFEQLYNQEERAWLIGESSGDPLVEYRPYLTHLRTGLPIPGFTNMGDVLDDLIRERQADKHNRLTELEDSRDTLLLGELDSDGWRRAVGSRVFALPAAPARPVQPVDVPAEPTLDVDTPLAAEIDAPPVTGDLVTDYAAHLSGDDNTAAGEFIDAILTRPERPAALPARKPTPAPATAPAAVAGPVETAGERLFASESELRARITADARARLNDAWDAALTRETRAPQVIEPPARDVDLVGDGDPVDLDALFPQPADKEPDVTEDAPAPQGPTLRERVREEWNTRVAAYRAARNKRVAAIRARLETERDEARRIIEARRAERARQREITTAATRMIDDRRNDPRGQYTAADIETLEAAEKLLRDRIHHNRSRNRYDAWVWRRNRRRLQDQARLYRQELARLRGVRRAEERATQAAEDRAARAVVRDQEARERRQAREVEDRALRDQRARDAAARRKTIADEQRATRELERLAAMVDDFTAWLRANPGTRTAEQIEALIDQASGSNKYELANLRKRLAEENKTATKRRNGLSAA